MAPSGVSSRGEKARRTQRDQYVRRAVPRLPTTGLARRWGFAPGVKCRWCPATFTRPETLPAHIPAQACPREECQAKQREYEATWAISQKETKT
jgi:hypothetical protein